MNYSVEEYKKDIDKNGIEEVWLHILEYCKYSKNGFCQREKRKKSPWKERNALSNRSKSDSC